MIKKSNKVVCTAKILFEEAKKLNKNSFYIPNGITKIEKYNFKPIKKIKIIGFLGSLGKWVEVEHLIELAKNFKNIKIEVIGFGEQFNKLDYAKNKLNLKNLILYGFLSHDLALEKIKIWDLAIIPFKINKITNAVYPIKLFEYWMCGKPVMTTKTTELSQFQKEIIFYNNKKDLIDAVKKLKNNKNFLNKIALNGFNRINDFVWDGKLGERLRGIVEN